MKLAFKTALFITTVFLLSACTSAPEGITPVKNFDLEKYQGKWYEIARLDHSFEQGMEQTVEWYINHQEWCENVTSGKYQRERLGI